MRRAEEILRARPGDRRRASPPARRRARRGALIALVVLSATGCAEVSSRAGETSAVTRLPAAAGGARGAAFGHGSLIGADSLSNTTIGGPKGTVLAYRFRAPWSGPARAVRFNVIFNPRTRAGYSGGTNGVLRIALSEDSATAAHFPVGRPLATAVIHPSPGDEWPLVRFERPPPLVKGRLYHVVFTNIDPSPRANYASINAFVQHGHGEALPHIPNGLAAMLGNTSDGGRTPTSWRPRSINRGDRYIPILEVVGGTPVRHIGVGYMEAWVSRPKTIGGSDGVRQLFRTTGRRAITVTGAWLRVRRLGSSSASLALRLERPGGAVLTSARVAAHDISSTSPEWAHVRFPRGVRLAPGSLVALRAAAERSSAYSTFPVRKGTDFGFDRRTVFTGGYAQFSTGSGWTGWDQWGVSDRHDGDLQFALDLR